MRLPRLGLLHDHDYRMLYASTSVSQFGFHITRLAIPLAAVTVLSASPFEVGLLTAVTLLPFLLIGLPAGAWIDRMRRQRVLIIADVGRAVVLLTVPVTWWLGALTIWQLYAVAFVVGIFTVFFDVAYQSYLPHLVGRAQLLEGNAKLQAVRAVAQISGPALAGQLVRLVTAPVALLVDAIALAASALFIRRIHKEEPAPAQGKDRRLFREIGEGLQFVVRHPLLRAVAATTATFNLFSGIYGAMLILYLERVIGLNAGQIGLVFTVVGAGGLLGAMVARRFSMMLGEGPAIWLPPAVLTPFALLMPLIAAPGWRIWLATAGWAIVATGVVIYNITHLSLLQRITPDHLLGRMNATMRFLVWGTAPIGGLLGGVLGETLGIRTALLIGVCGACLAFLPVFLSPLRTLRAAPGQEEQEKEGSRIPDA